MARKSMRLGGGGRFQKLERTLGHRSNVTDSAALAAYEGRKKLGKAKFQELAARGRRRAARAK
jgi:hypothetical protein